MTAEPVRYNASTEEDIINLQYKDPDSGKIVKEKQVRNNIFRDANIKISKFRKMYLKLLEKLVNLIISHIDKHMEHKSRFNRIHRWVKQFIVHKGLRMSERIIGKHLVKKITDIPEEPHNNHMRMWFDAWNGSIDDLWGLHVHQQALMNKNVTLRTNHLKQFPTKEDFIKHMQKTKTPSETGRRLLAQIYVTEVLEDTADRTTCDCFCMRLCHNMMEFYGVNPVERDKVPRPGQYPIYLADKEKNKQFFVAFANIPVWCPKDSTEIKVQDLERENAMLKDEIMNLRQNAVSVTNPGSAKKPEEVKI